MRKLIIEVIVIVSLFFVAANWATADVEEGARSGIVYETNVLEGAFLYCDVSWGEMDERCQTTNYFHFRNAVKKKAIVIHKYDTSQPVREEDVYFFVSNGDYDCWQITCEFVRDGGAIARIWTVWKVDMEDNAAPETILLRAMLLEYIEEINRAHQEKEGGEREEGVKDIDGRTRDDRHVIAA